MKSISLVAVLSALVFPGQAIANCVSENAAEYQRGILNDILEVGDQIAEKEVLGERGDMLRMKEGVRAAVAQTAAYRLSGCPAATQVGDVSRVRFSANITGLDRREAAKSLLWFFDQDYGNSDETLTDAEIVLLNENPGTRIVLEIAGW